MVKVLLVDDDPTVRTGLKFLLDSADDLEVVAEVGVGGRKDGRHRWAKQAAAGRRAWSMLRPVAPLVMGQACGQAVQQR